MDRSVLTRALQTGIGLPGALFSLIGVGLLVGSFFLAQQAVEAQREWIRVEGTIVDFSGGETQAPIVEYQAPDGRTRTVTGRVSSRPRAGKLGDRVPVLINPDDSEIVRLGTPFELWFAPGLLGGIGAVFLLFGTLTRAAAGAARLPGQLSERRIQALRETGDRVMARVVEIMSVGAIPTGRAAAHWRLRAEWREPAGAVRIFISQPIAVDPSPHVRVGDEIGVFIDRENPNIYAFDLSILPFGG
ncbi:MAG: DUF3592 domain-containing protein [Parvularculaceae bacterium]